MTLAYHGKSKRRGVGLALAAVLAIILGTVGAVSLQGGSARADADQTQLNLSDSACVAGGINLHFVAPHAKSGEGGDLSVTYTLDGTSHTVSGVAEDTSNSSVNAQWNVMLSGSGTFVLTDASTTKGLAYDGNGSDEATRTCGTQTVETGTLTVIKHVVDAPSGVTAADYTLTVSQGSSMVKSGAGAESPGTTYTLNAGTYVVAESGGQQANSVGFIGDCDANGNVAVTAGGSATCTITNTFNASSLTGSITINKHWQEADGTDATTNLPAGVDFTYTGANGGGSFTLNADGKWTWNLPDAPVGYYHFDEASIPGWHTVEVHCYSSAVSPRSAVAPEADASFTLKEGESWTCDFTNQRVEQSSQTYTVTVEKYISDALATTGSFSLSSSTTASNVPGCETGCANNPFTLDSTNGWMATTTAMAAGSVYSVEENGVAASAGACTPSDTYYLAGYRVGTTLAAAQTADLMPSASITDLQSNMVVIVVNQLCQQSNVGGTITVVKQWEDANGHSTTSNLPTDVTFTYGTDGTIVVNAGDGWTADATNVAPGHYEVSEPTLDGWHVISAECVNSAAQPGLAPVAVSVSFDLAEGDHWTCTFVNQAVANSQTYTVTIAKYISGAHADATNANNTTFNMDVAYTLNGTSGTGTFTLSPAPGTNTTNAYEAVTVPLTSADAYATNETGVPTAPGQCTADTPYYLAGYRVSSTSLADAATQTLSTTSPSFTNLTSNQYVIVVNQPCQAQNLVGSITIVKSWEDATGSQVSVDSSQIASFAGTGTGVGASFDLTSAGNYRHQFFGLASGTYSFTESPIHGWTLTGITCAGNTASTPTFDVPGAMLSINFVNTEGMTCTFHNQQQTAPTGASLTIVKEWHDASGNVMTTGFGTADFTSTDLTGHTSFMLGTNNTSAPNMNELVISGITPGTYHITEVGQAGWTFVSATCSSNAMQNSLAPSTSFGVVVPENGNITCTVVNQAVATSTTGSITIMKQWQDASGNPMTSGMPATANFTSTGVGSDTFVLGSGGVWSQMFSGLAAGTFGFNEDLSGVTGWSLFSATCTDNGTSATVAFALNGSMYQAALAAGQNITCTFVNRATAGIQSFFPPTFTFIPVPAVVTTPTASPSASPSATTTTTAPTTVPTNTGNESPVTNTNNTGTTSQPSTLNNNAPSANNAVAGVQAPGAPSTGSGSAMSHTGNTLAIALGLVTLVASAAAFTFSPKNRS